jgi:hypothetical protein
MNITIFLFLAVGIRMEEALQLEIKIKRQGNIDIT